MFASTFPRAKNIRDAIDKKVYVDMHLGQEYHLLNHANFSLGVHADSMQRILSHGQRIEGVMVDFILVIPSLYLLHCLFWGLCL